MLNKATTDCFMEITKPGIIGFVMSIMLDVAIHYETKDKMRMLQAILPEKKWFPFPCCIMLN